MTTTSAPVPHAADHSCGPTCPVGYFARKAEREARPMGAGLAAIVKATREGTDWVGEYHDRFMPKG